MLRPQAATATQMTSESRPAILARYLTTPEMQHGFRTGRVMWFLR
jgi:hypothetical protein